MNREYKSISRDIMEKTSQHILTTSSGETVFRTDNSIIVRLPHKRAVLSTAWVNGGYRTDLEAVFNHQPSHEATTSHQLEGGSVEAYHRITSERLGLDPEKTAGLITAADMKHASVATDSFRGLDVTAVITGGIEVNGGRAGDPASYYQESRKTERVGGTINTILLIGADLPQKTLVRAVITAAEAKTVALQQLMAQSRYSSGIATGSGTDGIAIVADTSSDLHLTDAGKHSKLGELIGKVVIQATTRTLEQQTGLSPVSQRDVMVRLGRFSISEEEMWNHSCSIRGENRRTDFIRNLREMSPEPALVAAVGAVLHLHDEITWGLIPQAAGQGTAVCLLSSVPRALGIPAGDELNQYLRQEESVLWNTTRMVAWIAKQRVLA